MNTERDIDAIASWGDESGDRHTGPRRELPARCYCCGEDIEDRSVLFDGHEFCSRGCMDTWVRR